jgi:hypothetical protein
VGKGIGMSNDPLTILGLARDECTPFEIDRRFIARRRELREALDDPACYFQARRGLEDLYQAYRTLRSIPTPEPPDVLIRIAKPSDGAAERIAYLRRMIEVSLESGLLRCTRRQEIVAEGRRLKFSEFQMQLLIAQVQYGGALMTPPVTDEQLTPCSGLTRIGVRIAAAGVLALALFLSVVRWLVE